MKKFMLKNHKKYFEFYIAYGKKLLDVRNIKHDDQSKYLEYIVPCVSKYEMKSNKQIPRPIGQLYDPDNKSNG